MLELRGSVNADYPSSLRWYESDSSGDAIDDQRFLDRAQPRQYADRWNALFPFRSRELIREYLRQVGVSTPKFALLDTSQGSVLTFNIVELERRDGGAAMRAASVLKWLLPRVYSIVCWDDTLATEML